MCRFRDNSEGKKSRIEVRNCQLFVEEKKSKSLNVLRARKIQELLVREKFFLIPDHVCLRNTKIPVIEKHGFKIYK